MAITDDLLAEIRQRHEEDLTAGPQFEQGLIKGGSLGYLGEDTPKDLPLTGKLARMGGEAAGAIPAFAAGGAAAGAMGIGGLAGEVLMGGLYGLVRKPEATEGRVSNMLEDAALFGATHVGLRALAAAAKPIGRALGLIGEEAGPVLDFSTSPFKTPKDLEDYVFSQKNLSEGGAVPPGGPGGPGPMAGFFQTPEELETYAKQASGLAPPFAETPGAAESALGAEAFDRTIGPAAADLAKNTPLEAELMAKAGKIGEEDIKAASEQASMDAGKANLGEPVSGELPGYSRKAAARTAADTGLVDSLLGGSRLESQKELQQTVDEIMVKNDLPAQVPMIASQVQEPINYVMSKGVNFNDAKILIDALAERGKIPFEPEKDLPAIAAAPPAEPSKIVPLRTVKFEGPNAPGVIPEFDRIKDHVYQPDETFDLFYNTRVKPAEAVKFGLLEPRFGGTVLTEKGYDFLYKYNPEGLAGRYPEFIDRKLLGAIRGQGESDINLSHEELRAAGLKMPLQRALDQGFIRPGLARNGEVLPELYQLEQKGAGMLAGGRGANANVNLKAFDLASNLRSLPEDVEGIAARAAENERRELLFKDLWEELDGFKKGCED